MSGQPPDLRVTVAEIIREVLADLAAETTRRHSPAPTAQVEHVPAAAGAPGRAAPRVAGSQYVMPSQPRERDEAVRICDDEDVDQFVRKLLRLFDNPKSRQDIRAGRLRFRLQAGLAPAAAVERHAQRIDTGAVTERHVNAAAEAGRRLILGRRAVLTPLAREKARALGVPIEKER